MALPLDTSEVNRNEHSLPSSPLAQEGEGSNPLSLQAHPSFPRLQALRRSFRKALRTALRQCETLADDPLAHERRARLEALWERFTAWEKEATPEESLPVELAAEARALRIHVAGFTELPSPQKEPSLRGVRIFYSKDGRMILVGKNAAENDRLSFEIARGEEWWFHVAHYQGSHVVVREENPEGKEASELPPETLLDAMHLAVYFSKARGASRAEVTCSQVKYLRKKKGAPAGQVWVLEGKTIPVRIEKTRLERLLQGNVT